MPPQAHYGATERNIMGLFDAIKDALTFDDKDRLDLAQKEVAKLQADLTKARDAGDSAAIADIQTRLDAAEATAHDLGVKLGTVVDHNAEATPVPVEPSPVPEPDIVAEPVVEAAPVETPEPVAAAPAPVPEPAPAPAPAPAAPEYRTYTVKKGDTLSAIGRHYGVPYMAIAKLNNIKNPDLIYPGQVFNIPN